MAYATGNQISIYYEVHGHHGSPLLMIIGLGASIGDWLPEQIEQLSQKHRVILFDNRDAGQSEKLTTAYTMADFAADAVSVLDALAINKAHILGASMGGMIAQHIALNHAERVMSLILGCTTPTFNLEHPQFVAPSQEVLAELVKPPSGNREQDIESSWKRNFTVGFIERNRDLLDRLRDIALAAPALPPEANQRQTEAILNTHDTYHRLAQIQHPTLLQTGAEDLIIPAENSRIMARLIANARLIEYPDCGHLFFEAGGEKVINDILNFLEEVDVNQ